MIEAVLDRSNGIYKFGICNDVAKTHSGRTKALAERTDYHKIFEFRKKRNAAFSAKIAVRFINDKHFVRICGLNHRSDFITCKPAAGRCIRICKNNSGTIRFCAGQHLRSIKRPVCIKRNYVGRNIVEAGIYRIKTVRKFRQDKPVRAVKKRIEHKR